MNLSALDNALWAASLLGHVALALVLTLRGKWRQFPVFFSYVTFSAAGTVVLFVLSKAGTKHEYFLAYWTTGAANYLFQIGLIAEIARSVLQPTGRWVMEARRVFLVGTAIGLMCSAGAAFEMTKSQSAGLDLWDARLTIFTDLLTSGSFVALLMASNRLGLRWQNQAFALGQGLFIWAAIALCTDIGHTIFGWSRDFVLLDHVRMFAYLSVVIYWGVRFWLPETERAELSPEIRAYLVAVAERVKYDSDSKVGSRS